ncbi:MAG: N-acetyltransferase [Pseudomonadota bacterium]
MSHYTIAPESPENSSAIEQLHALTFGPGRFARAAFRLREEGPHDLSLSSCAIVDLDGTKRLVGSVRLTWVSVGDAELQGLLLGPLAVDPTLKGQGIGRSLMTAAVKSGRESDAAFILLVGDEAFYKPYGFEVVTGLIDMPGPVDRKRLLINWLKPDKRMELSGRVCYAA